MSLAVALRKRLGAAAFDGFFHGVSRLGRLHPRARASRRHVEVVRDVEYGTLGRAHRLDVYRPTSSDGRLPIVLYVHGGGFRILSKDTHWSLALAFARRGYVVFNVNYRLAPRHRFPAALEDVCDAYLWVLEHAHEYGGDATRVAIAGESAGANLTSALTLATCFRRDEPFARRVFDRGVVPNAWLPYCGVLQVSDIGRLRRRWPTMSRFVEDRLVDVEDAYLGPDPVAHGPMLDLADPLRLLESDRAPDRPIPACFATCGTKDPLIADTQRLEAALSTRGVPHRAVYYPGEPHAFHALPWRPGAARCWQDTDRFLAEFGPQRPAETGRPDRISLHLGP